MLVFEVPNLLDLESAFVALRAASTVGAPSSTLMLQLEAIAGLDDRGVRTIAGLAQMCRRSSTRLILVGLEGQPTEALRRAGVAATLGEIGFCRDLIEAQEIVGVVDINDYLGSSVGCPTASTAPT